MRLGCLTWMMTLMVLPSAGWSTPPDCTAGSVASLSSPIHEWITFHASFDTGTMADLAYGEASPRSPNPPIEARMVTGRFSRALELGRSPAGQQEMNYDRRGNADLTSPGAVSFWIRPILWKSPGTQGEYLPFLRFQSRDGTFLIERDRRSEFFNKFVGRLGETPTPEFSCHEFVSFCFLACDFS
jgi:hypothetical protein